MQSRVLIIILSLCLWFYPVPITESHSYVISQEKPVLVTKPIDMKRIDSLCRLIRERRESLLKNNYIIKNQKDTLKRYE